MKTHKDLDVWRKSVSLVTSIYEVTKTFPNDEIYGLTNQIRRSSVSIPSNIAEGNARQGDKEFAHFLYISLGSLSELETQLIIASSLNYLSLKDYDSVITSLEEIRRMLLGLIKYVRNRQ
ncbi:MAG TPA: four helix bundle protein [Dysgonamonadaceae bacterium]|nr:four helix bundle protein [Dysgonamonadaceae bacterium]